MNTTFTFLQPGENFSRKSACFTCRERRKKCNFAVPSCARCVRVGVHCVYTEPEKKNPNETSWIDKQVNSIERQITESLSELWRIRRMVKQAKTLEVTTHIPYGPWIPSLDTNLLVSNQDKNDTERICSIENEDDSSNCSQNKKKDLILTQTSDGRSRIQLTFSNFTELQIALQKAIEISNLSWAPYASSPFYKSPDTSTVVIPQYHSILRYTLQIVPSSHKLDLSGLPDISLNEIPNSMKKTMAEFYFGQCMLFPFYSEGEFQTDKLPSSTDISEDNTNKGQSIFLKSVYARAASHLSDTIMKGNSEHEMNYRNLSYALAASVKRSSDFDDMSPYTIMAFINLLDFFLSKSDIMSALFYFEHIRRVIYNVCMNLKNLSEGADHITREIYRRMIWWMFYADVRLSIYIAPERPLLSEELCEKVAGLPSLQSSFKSSSHSSSDQFSSTFDPFGSIVFVAEMQFAKILSRINRVVYWNQSVVTIAKILELKGMLDNWKGSISDALNFFHQADYLLSLLRFRRIKDMMEIDYYGSILYLYFPSLVGSEIFMSAEEVVLIFQRDVFQTCLNTALILVELIEHFLNNYGFAQFYSRLFNGFNLTFEVFCHVFEHGDATQKAQAKEQIRRCNTLMQNSPYMDYRNGPACQFAYSIAAMVKKFDEEECADIPFI